MGSFTHVEVPQVRFELTRISPLILSQLPHADWATVGLARQTGIEPAYSNYSFNDRLEGG